MRRGTCTGRHDTQNDLLGQMRYEWLHVGHSSRRSIAMATFAERHQDLDLGALVTCTTS